MKNFIKMLRDESGASAAEYALILAIVGTGIAVASWALGDAINDNIKDSANCVGATTSAEAATQCKD